MVNASHRDPAVIPVSGNGPVESASVFWVGHSLVETKAPMTYAPGMVDLVSLTGQFASARGLEHFAGEHTLWGSSLSALWRGFPHSYDRDASDMVAKRERFEIEAELYDTLILTEAIPLRPVLKNEFSAYYVRLFTGALKKAKPDARIFLYQTWVNLQGGGHAGKDGSYGAHDWRSDMAEQRRDWEWLANTAATPRVRQPSWRNRLWPSYGDGGFRRTVPVLIIPAGNAMVALAGRIASSNNDDDFKLPDGEMLSLAHLFANPFIKSGGQLRLLDPDKPYDDIHPSATGIYFVALVHFATIYRQSPIGLPDTLQLGEGVARILQTVAWETVANDPRAGLTVASRGRR